MIDTFALVGEKKNLLRWRHLKWTKARNPTIILLFRIQWLKVNLDE